MLESSAGTVVADVTLTAHVAAGVVALLAGLAAMVTRKGGARHNKAGKIYVFSMVFVVTSAVPLSVWIENWFLLAVAVFSGYLVVAGYRVIVRRRAGLTEPSNADYAVHGTMLTTGGVMVVVGGWGTVSGTLGLAPVLAVFGFIGASLAVRELRQLRTSLSDRTPWFERHIAFMGGGYIATVTAAVTVNLTMIPPLARWLGPTAVGVPLIFYAVRKYSPVFGRRSA
ncbi:MAG: hypothetical protein U5J64_05530 [Halobacteriales archaeon]|nr:hypothetical protein [Halobacteriales archaeon]